MSDAIACAAAPAPKPQVLETIVARDKVLDHLDHSLRSQMLLVERLGRESSSVAWAQTVQDILPDLAPSLRDDAAAAACNAWRNRVPRRIKPVRRRARRIA